MATDAIGAAKGSNKCCLRCGGEFIAKSSRNFYCSRLCQKRSTATAFKRRKSQKYQEQLAAQRRICAHCDSEFVPATYQQRFCQPKCKATFGSKLTWLRRGPQRAKYAHRQCPECNKVFAPRDGRQVGCSVACGNKVSARIGARCRRSKMAERFVERVDPFEVFKRDGWRCQLCGVPTPKTMRGKNAPNSPELDHIEALSRGGEHSYRNTQCACRKCNVAKGPKASGQLRLFG